jgi:hypothetical protein
MGVLRAQIVPVRREATGNSWGKVVQDVEAPGGDSKKSLWLLK